MKKELEDKLFNKYPKIFRQRKLPMTETCMNWGIECGDGWYNILDMLCKQIQWHIDVNLNDDEDGEEIQVEAIQVKEKFGSLRFYHSGGNKFIYGMVAMAEAMTMCTCESCGAPGTQSNSKWITTLCEDCRKG